MTTNEWVEMIYPLLKTDEDLCHLLDAIPIAIDKNGLANIPEVSPEEPSDTFLFDTAADWIYEVAGKVGDLFSVPREEGV